MFDTKLGTVDLSEGVVPPVEELAESEDQALEVLSVADDVDPEYLPISFTGGETRQFMNDEEKLFDIMRREEYLLYDEHRVANYLDAQVTPANADLWERPAEKRNVLLWNWRPLHKVSDEIATLCVLNFRFHLVYQKPAPRPEPPKPPKTPVAKGIWMDLVGNGEAESHHRREMSEYMRELRMHELSTMGMGMGATYEYNTGFFDNEAYPLPIPVPVVRRIGALGRHLKEAGVEHVVVIGGPVSCHINDAKAESFGIRRSDPKRDPFVGVILPNHSSPTGKRVYTFDHWDEPGFRLVRNGYRS